VKQNVNPKPKCPHVAMGHRHTMRIYNVDTLCFLLYIVATLA